MFTKRTIIGIGAGITISAIGVVALITSFGIQSINVDETIVIGDNTIFSFNAPLRAKENLVITGNAFAVTLQTPGDGKQIAEQEFKNELTLDWIVLEEGQNRLEIQNKGDSELKLEGAFEVSSDPILFTYHILVITAGVVIIGFSAAFSVKKPRGF
ncbi:MAG: hypothetical protein WD154_00410 [Nitrosopumilaceae archaeon]